MKNGITLIAYRDGRCERHEAYLQVYAQLSWDELEDHLTKYETKNLQNTRYDNAYEFTILIDGLAIRGDYKEGIMVPKYADDESLAAKAYEAYNAEWDRYCKSLEIVLNNAKRKALRAKELLDEEAARQSAEIKKKEAEHKQLVELKTLADLQAKYPHFK
jgi:hypothetical protein